MNTYITRTTLVQRKLRSETLPYFEHTCSVASDVDANLLAPTPRVQTPTEAPVADKKKMLSSTPIIIVPQVGVRAKAPLCMELCMVVVRSVDK
jgi:hypothetical protein